MWYLVIQTSLILLVTAGAFFALGFAMPKLLAKRRKAAADGLTSDDGLFVSATGEHAAATPVAAVTDLTDTDTDTDTETDGDTNTEIDITPDIAPADASDGDLAQLRATVAELEAQLEQKDQVIDGLSRQLQAAAPAPTDEKTGEALLEKIPQMEAALETQGALLESKTVALEKMKIQYDRERERATALEAKAAALESKVAEYEHAQAQNLWGAAEAEANAAAPESPTQAPSVEAIAELTAAKDHEIEVLAGERDALRTQLAQLQGNLDELKSGWEEMENRLRFQEADVAAVATLQEKVANFERERQQSERAESGLREQLEAMERQHAADTTAVNELRERLAAAQRQAESLAQREQEWQQVREADQATQTEHEAEMAVLRDRIENYEHELVERQQAEAELRAEIERLETRIEEEEERSSHTREIDPSMLSRLARVEAELVEKREELRRREQELSEQYTLRIQDMERTVESMLRAQGGGSASAPTMGPEPAPEIELADVVPLQKIAENETPIKLETDDDTLRLRLDQLRFDLLLKEDQRLVREEERLQAIQIKLEQIESELLSVDRTVRESQGGGGVELTEMLLRLESMIKEQERHVMSAMSTAAAAHAAPMPHLAAMPYPMPPYAPMAPSAMAASFEPLQRMLAERENLIATLKRQLEDLSNKVDPQLVGEDNLQLIHGVGPYTKKILRDEFGISTFRQVSQLTPELIERISARLYFRGRIQREDWLGQARELHQKKYNEAA